MASSDTGKLFTLASNYEFYFNWTLNSQDVESNSSNISWEVSVKDICGQGLGSYAGVSTRAQNFKVSIKGITYSLGTVEVNCPVNGTVVIASDNVNIPHDSFDSQSFVAYINWSQFGNYYNNSTGWTTYFNTVSNKTYTGVIDYIVRSASIEAVQPSSDLTDEDEFTITYKNPAGDYALELQACISFTGGNDDIPYRDIPKTGNTYTFVLTEAEKATLYTKLDEGYTSISVRFYVRSRVPAGSSYETAWDYITRTITFVNYKPIFDSEVQLVVDNNSDTTRLTGDVNTFVAGMSDAYFVTGATARKGATIVKQYISNGNQQVDNAASGTISNVDNNTFYFYVEDNRGYVERDFKVVNWIPYVKPTCKVATDSITTSGVLPVHLSGKYFNGSFGDVTNSLYVDYLIYPLNSSGSWVTKKLSPSVDTENNYTVSFNITGLDYDTRYHFEVRVYDELTTSEDTSGIVAAKPLFDWDKDDFRFFIPVQMDKGFVYPQTVLWSGASQMGDGEVITLDYPVSEQPTGIVLVFSLYRNGAAEDVSICSFFKSRAEIQYLMPNGKHTFLMGINSNLSVFGAKYITIEDNRLTGFEGNTKSGTAASGITFDNSQFVLRYVIGV